MLRECPRDGQQSKLSQRKNGRRIGRAAVEPDGLEGATRLLPDALRSRRQGGRSMLSTKPERERTRADGCVVQER